MWQKNIENWTKKTQLSIEAYIYVRAHTHTRVVGEDFHTHDIQVESTSINLAASLLKEVGDQTYQQRLSVFNIW